MQPIAPRPLDPATQVGAALDLDPIPIPREVRQTEMGLLVPWSAESPSIGRRDRSPRGRGAGRRPSELGWMPQVQSPLRWYALADFLVREALRGSGSMRRFVWLGLVHERPHGECNALEFRYPLARRGLATQATAEGNAYFAQYGVNALRGTSDDAAIIAAPSPIRNQAGARVLKMHQTKRGTRLYFPMEPDTGVGMNTGVVQAVTATASDMAEVPRLPCSNEGIVRGDAGYVGGDRRVPTKRWDQLPIAAKRGEISPVEDVLHGTVDQIAHKTSPVRCTRPSVDYATPRHGRQ